ncbi:hypothetical protein ACFY4C_06725 [Actinomadura viridis]|uniref:hypothetical protein n=1 Tax=Actinomadura viridis TaxID=58110 RepID=UPI0036B6C672
MRSASLTQRLGYFPKLADVPAVVAEHIRSVLGLPEGVMPAEAAERSAKRQRSLVRTRMGVKDASRFGIHTRILLFMYAVRKRVRESDVAEQSAGYEQETREVLEWFERYDALVAAADLDAMADQAAFPINEVTDDADGFGVVGPCDRDRFIAQMREVVAGSGAVQMESTRRPIFLSRALCFVVTDATITAGGESQTMRYGDLLIKTADGWRFQTMVAGGWAEQM